MYNEGFWHLKTPIFLGPCDFGNEKLCRAWPKLRIFWNWTPTQIPDRQKRVGFQKSKKGSVTPPYTLHKSFDLVVDDFLDMVSVSGGQKNVVSN